MDKIEKVTAINVYLEIKNDVDELEMTTQEKINYYRTLRDLISAELSVQFNTLKKEKKGN